MYPVELERQNEMEDPGVREGLLRPRKWDCKEDMTNTWNFLTWAKDDQKFSDKIPCQDEHNFLWRHTFSFDKDGVSVQREMPEKI